jgi:alpha-1,6-mannosyltransferase
MHLVDTTLFFSPTSGGVRRYLTAKHAWLANREPWTHSLLVPGEPAVIRRRVEPPPASVLARRLPPPPTDRAHLQPLEPGPIEAVTPFILRCAWRVAQRRGIPVSRSSTHTCRDWWPCAAGHSPAAAQRSTALGL